jgi:hypothetical protein
MFHAGGLLPVMIYDAEIRIGTSRFGNGEPLQVIAFNVVADTRVLDTKASRSRPIISTRLFCKNLPNGEFDKFMDRPDVLAYPETIYKLMDGTAVPENQIKTGSVIQTSLEYVKKAFTEKQPEFLLALAESLELSSKNTDEVRLPEEEARLERIREKHLADPEGRHESIESRAETIDKIRNVLAAQLDVQAKIRREYERSGGTPSDAAQRAAQQAARVIEERVDAAARNKIMATDAEARRIERERIREIESARKARLDGTAETLLTLLREVATPEAIGDGYPSAPPGGWEQWLKLASKALISVDPVKESNLPDPEVGGPRH